MVTDCSKNQEPVTSKVASEVTIALQVQQQKLINQRSFAAFNESNG